MSTRRTLPYGGTTPGGSRTPVTGANGRVGVPGYALSGCPVTYSFARRCVPGKWRGPLPVSAAPLGYALRAVPGNLPEFVCNRAFSACNRVGRWRPTPIITGGTTVPRISPREGI